MSDRLERAEGALLGLALGDALGMPTQGMTRAAIRSALGMVTGLVDAPPEQRIASGMKAGRVTDDTQQALLLAQELIVGRGGIDPRRWAGRLADWEQSMRAAGSQDLLGPSTREAVRRLRAGAALKQAGRSGTTNGAAMRVTPVALVSIGHRPVVDLNDLVDRVAAACVPTHHTGVAISGACAIAGVVAAGVAGETLDAAIDVGLRAAMRGSQRGEQVPHPVVVERILYALKGTRELGVEEAADWLVEHVGTGVATAESVPASLGLLRQGVGDPRGALLAAAMLGGDTDTVGAMLGAMLGALLGRRALPREWTAQVLDVNGLDLRPVASSLLGAVEGQR